MRITTKMLSEKETAQKLGVTTDTLAKWRRCKRSETLLFFVKLGSRIYYHPKDVGEFIEQYKGVPLAGPDEVKGVLRRIKKITREERPEE